MERLAKQSQLLTNYARDLINQQDYVTGGLLALEAIGEQYPGIEAFPAAPEALSLIETAYRNQRERAVDDRPNRIIRSNKTRQRFIAFSWPNTLRVLSSVTGEELYSFQHPAKPKFGAMSNSGDILATFSEEGEFGSLYLWSQGRLLRKIRGPRIENPELPKPISSVTFDASDRRVVTGGENKKLYVWNVETGSEEKVVPTPHQYWIDQLAFSADGRFLVSQSRDSAFVWDTRNWEPLRLDAQRQAIYTMELLPDGERVLLAGTRNGFVFDLATAKLVYEIKNIGSSVIVAPNGQSIYSVAPDASDEVKVWSAETGALPRSLKGMDGGKFSDLRINAAGTRLLASSYSRGAYVWDPASGEQLAFLRTNEGATIDSVEFLHDGDNVLVSYADRDGENFQLTTRKWRLDPMVPPLEQKDAGRTAALPDNGLN